ncbi:MAG: type II toxin-antitoxin system HicA family toxin [Candidatus Uhrbacteria bacterium]|nr:type II toxin-antitoxin system HicA family toxin [Candidatus Uhrbacteria bacterium]
MPHLSPMHWKRFDAFLISIGCVLVREKGDHRVYHREGLIRPIVIPRDTQIPVFILKNNLRLLGISQEDFLKAVG